MRRYINGTPQDEQEQLAMCIIPPGVQPPVYVSIWLALDDCDAINGCLEVGWKDAALARSIHLQTKGWHT